MADGAAKIPFLKEKKIVKHSKIVESAVKDSTKK